KLVRPILELLDGNVVWESVQAIPSIKFLERIYQLIDDGMAKVVVLKLLGKKIGFSSLYNRMQAIGNQNRLGN
ncbi:hypothetical protein Gogos_010681, partial [Gossypium gossypioides]|nr:hypothetical protein [Gossypium gossypioides]